MSSPVLSGLRVRWSREHPCRFCGRPVMTRHDGWRGTDYDTTGRMGTHLCPRPTDSLDIAESTVRRPSITERPPRTAPAASAANGHAESRPAQQGATAATQAQATPRQPVVPRFTGPGGIPV